MDVRPGYCEFAPPRGLGSAVECLWVRVVPPRGPTTDVLPDACSDLIWQADRGAFIAGPDTGPVGIDAAPGTVFVGARFVPGAGGPAFAVPLSAMRNQRVDVTDVRPELEHRLPPSLTPAEALRRVTTAAAELAMAGPPDPTVSAAAHRLVDPAARVETLADDLGVSERQLRRRFHAAVGYGPKTLQRVLRFRRFLNRLDADETEPDLAYLALVAGYADQAHLTRECGQLAGLPPAALARTRTGADELGAAS